MKGLLPSIKVGDKFTLKCGTVVTVIFYNTSRYIVVEGEDGRRKKVRATQLHHKLLSWTFQDLSCHVGKKYKLNSGVTITIKEILELEEVLVEDSDGNTKIAKMGAIKRGYLSWEDYGYPAIKNKYNIGHKFMLNCGVEVKIVKFNSPNMVVLEDNEGNQKVSSLSCTVKGTVSWKEFGTDQNGIKVLVGDVFKSKDGFDLTVIECGYSEEGRKFKTIVQDVNGKQAIVSRRMLSSGELNWKLGNYGVLKNNKKILCIFWHS